MSVDRQAEPAESLHWSEVAARGLKASTQFYSWAITVFVFRFKDRESFYFLFFFN